MTSLIHKRGVALAAMLAALVGPAWADDQTFAFNMGTAGFGQGGDWGGTAVTGGSDVVTLTGLGAGTYSFDLTMSSQFLSNVSVTLNGQAASTSNMDPAGKFTFSWLSSTTSVQPMVLEVFGTPMNLAGKVPMYSGEVQVSAVPEASTTAMFAAGLAVLAFVGRRRQSR